MPSHYLKNNLVIFLLFLGFSYAMGVLFVGHYSMIHPSYYIALWGSALVGIAIFFGLRAVHVKKIGISTTTWIGLALVVAIQPFVHHINYADALVFPVGFLLLAGMLSVVVVNIPDDKRPHVIHGIAWCLLVIGILSAVTQYIQLFYPNQFDFISRVSLPMSRSEGNVSQPNQASFIAVLSTTAIFYLSHQLHQSAIKKTQNVKHHHNKLAVFFGLSLCFLMSAIALTLSRTGLVLYALALCGMLFYPWVSHKWRFGLFGVGIAISTLGYQIGSRLGKSLLSIQDTTGVDRLMSTGSELRGLLWERAWWAFSSNPMTGIGYNNYLWYGWENIERLTWLENADHAHNVVLQIGAELGLLGLVMLLGVVVVLCHQFILFVQKKLKAQELFLCIMFALFVAYSFSEFPLWYPFLAFPFVVFVGLLDRGFSVKVDIKKPLLALTVVLSVLATFYAGFYHHYLRNYEIVIAAKVDNQQKIDAYHGFPSLLGFIVAKEHMLHLIVDDEKTDNVGRFIEMGERLMKAHPDIGVMEVQARLLMKHNKQQEADEINRKLCIWERQSRIQANYSQVHCATVVMGILKIDPNDDMGYAKRLNDWYQQRYGDENK